MKTNPMQSFALALALAAGAAHADVDVDAANVKLTGVDPAHYLQKRNLRPDVTAELKALPHTVALAVLAHPERFVVDASQSKAQRAVELRALKTGALTALAQSSADDTVVLAALQRGVADDDVAVAAVAAERIGDRGAVAVLKAIVVDDVRVDVRAAAVAGLGRARDNADAALAVLVDVVSGDVVSGDAVDVVRAAGVRALAHLGSRWAWEARGDVAGGERVRAAARGALALAKGGPRVDVAIAETRSMLQ
jgi:hypothetical protein